MNDNKITNDHVCDNNLPEEKAEKDMLAKPDQQKDASLKSMMQKNTEPQQSSVSNIVATNENNASISNNAQLDTEETGNELNCTFSMDETLRLADKLASMEALFKEMNLIKSKLNMELTERQNSIDVFQQKVQKLKRENKFLEEWCNLIKSNIYKSKNECQDVQIKINAVREKIDLFRSLIISNMEEGMALQETPIIIKADNTEEVSDAMTDDDSDDLAPAMPVMKE